MPRVTLSRLVGRVGRARLPVPLARLTVGGYCALWGVDLAPAEPSEQPYPTLDALFTRRLRSGTRPVAPEGVVSPADGRLDAVGVISDGSLRIKGNDYAVAELTGDARAASRLRGGVFAVVYLSPRDYHRVHSPVDGEVQRVTGIPGDLFPVNALSERVPRLYCRNSRVAIGLETRDFGEVVVVMVGAMNVGRIGIEVLGGGEAAPGLSAIEPPRPVARGDEIGVFHLGSTVVVLCERAVSLGASGRRVRYGESLLISS